MPKRKTYTVTDSRGRAHRRQTDTRVYTHAVVHHMAEQEGANGKKWPAYSDSNWCGSRALAEKEARVWHRHPRCEGVEILEAVLE